jgi:hypothetical protein
MLAAAVLCSVAACDPVERVDVDLIELHHLTCGGAVVFSQIIYWHRCHEGPTRWRSAGFTIVRDADDLPTRAGRGGPWRVNVTRNERRYRVASNLYRERWLDFDPERASVELWRRYPAVDYFAKPPAAAAAEQPAEQPEPVEPN